LCLSSKAWEKIAKSKWLNRKICSFKRQMVPIYSEYWQFYC
jgi:hypothetical protein